MGIRERRNKRLVLLLAVEGDNKTEKLYFSAFNRIQKKYRVSFVPGNYTDAGKMADALLRHMKKIEFNAAAGDRAWCIFDLDAAPDKIRLSQKTVTGAAKRGFECAISNPCFEVWYICHFRYSTRWLKDGNAVIDELKKSIPEYRKGMDLFATLEPRADIALGNAGKLRDYHAGQGRRRCDEGANPYTEIHSVVGLLTDRNGEG